MHQVLPHFISVWFCAFLKTLPLQETGTESKQVLGVTCWIIGFVKQMISGLSLPDSQQEKYKPWLPNIRTCETYPPVHCNTQKPNQPKHPCSHKTAANRPFPSVCTFFDLCRVLNCILLISRAFIIHIWTLYKI